MLGFGEQSWVRFAERVGHLPIAIVVGADMLRRELDPVPEAARGLRLERLRNEVHDVAALLGRAITARPPCCGRSCGPLRHLGNSRRLMPRPWRGCLPIGKGTGANAASACRR